MEEVWACAGPVASPWEVRMTNSTPQSKQRICSKVTSSNESQKFENFFLLPLKTIVLIGPSYSVGCWGLLSEQITCTNRRILQVVIFLVSHPHSPGKCHNNWPSPAPKHTKPTTPHTPVTVIKLSKVLLITAMHGEGCGFEMNGNKDLGYQKQPTTLLPYIWNKIIDFYFQFSKRKLQDARTSSVSIIGRIYRKNQQVCLLVVPTLLRAEGAEHKPTALTSSPGARSHTTGICHISHSWGLLHPMPLNTHRSGATPTAHDMRQ